MDKIMMIGVGWEQLPMVNKAKKLGFYVIATTWWDENKIPADKVICLDSRDLDGIEKLYLEEKPDYVIADECDYSMYAVAFLSEKYNIPGPSLKVLTITNNKFLQREAISRIDVLQPEYSLCLSEDDILAFAWQHGYPIMIKPVDNRGSIGVSKVINEYEVKSASLLAVKNSHSRMCIVEKCIDGNVITADGFADSGGFEFIACSTKKMYENNINVAKALYYPGEVSDELRKKIKGNSEKIANCIGIRYGFAHIEFIVEKNTNDLYLVEVANRGGGVFISNIVLGVITGLDYCEALLRMAMGHEVNIKCQQEYKKKAMLFFLSLSGAESIEDITGFGECVKVIYIRKEDKSVNVINSASAGRQGVIVLEGEDFEDLEEYGKYFERKYGASDSEKIFIKEETGDA